MKYNKGKIHKQSKYITIMFVPESSASKVRSIKVGRWVWYSLGLGTTFIACTLTLSSFKILKFDSILSSVKNELKTKDVINSELMSKNKEVTNTFKNEKSNYESKLDNLEEKAKKVEEQLKELEKVKQDIYNKMASKNVPLDKNVTDISYDTDAMGGPFIASPKSNSKQDYINNSYDALIYSLNSMSLQFKDISSQVDKVTPYLNAYPAILPVEGKFTSYVGYRNNPFYGYSGSEYHSGLDIKAEKNTDVKATGAGKVTFSGYSGSYGYLIIIDHGYGIETRYGHNSSLVVNVGDVVKRGDVIAKSGSTGRSTGPHVHYEVRLNGEIQNPFDYIEEE